MDGWVNGKTRMKTFFQCLFLSVLIGTSPVFTQDLDSPKQGAPADITQKAPASIFNQILNHLKTVEEEMVAQHYQFPTSTDYLDWLARIRPVYEEAILKLGGVETSAFMVELRKSSLHIIAIGVN